MLDLGLPPCEVVVVYVLLKCGGSLASRVCTLPRFGITSHYVWQHIGQLALNLVVCVVLVIAKLPEMMGVRLLGKKASKRAE